MRSVVPLSVVILCLSATALALPLIPKNADWTPVIDAINASPFRNLTIIVASQATAAKGQYDFIYTKGTQTENTFYETASASKWISAAVIMAMVDRGILSLEDRPQKYIEWWTNDPSDPRSRITLSQLLSFTSGFQGSLLSCVLSPTTSYESCCRSIYANDFKYEPGTTYYYANQHMRIAGLMAMKATGIMDWNTLFDQYIRTPLALSSRSVYDEPSLFNPDPAGGLTSSAADFFKFLSAVLTRSIIPRQLPIMEADQTSNVVFANRPIPEEFDFHYGFGEWRECYGTWSTACEQQVSLNSIGFNAFLPVSR
eukprot:TRINITY_DN4959_c0_g2_i1.p1 TRINITY_DN4959_c0_g2~~TRINITY_DN4959_c0_g2_i1.p1  ORF type:complete len:312 (-),score=71.42 TRINITY_DN4959_c0_g2_i1:136-1071(-)